MPTIPVITQPAKNNVQMELRRIVKSKLLLLIVIIAFIMLAMVARHGLNAGRVDASTTALPGMAGAVLSPPARPQSEEQIVHIPYFIEQGDMTSTLTLNNNVPEPTEVKVTVFNSKGEAFTAPTITLPPMNAERLGIRELTKEARGDFHSGNVQVSYYGPSMGVTSQISIAAANKRIAFESAENSTMDFASSRLDGIVWVADNGTQASAVLTNTTSDSLTISFGTQLIMRSLTLNAHETQVVDLKPFIMRRQGASAALVHIEHNGMPGALMVTGFAINERSGFSCNLPFIDRATAKTAQLAGAHVRFGRADAKEGFPAGTRFSAPLLVANAGDAPSTAHIFVDYTIGGVAHHTEIATLNLAPQELRQVEIASELARRNVSGPVDDAGVDIAYSGTLGSVIARLTSVDQSGDYAFEVPVKDPLAESMRVGGSYPWRLDGGYTTVLHLKNTSDKRVYALVQVRYEGGSYNLERLPLQPFQSIAVDIKQLRDAQQKDIRDSVMPSDVAGGQIGWFEEEVGSLIGRAEVRNVAEGVSSSFSCGDVCPCPPASSSTYLTPGSSAGDAGGTAQFQAMEQRQDCRGTVFGPYNRTSDSAWSSSDMTVFTVSGGLVSCLQSGSGTVQAQFQGTVYGQFCNPIIITQRPGGSVAVKPKINSLSPARGVQGLAYNLTITGKGFKSPATVSIAGTGITISGTQVGSSTEIITSFTIADTAPGGNHAVTVTAGGQTSASVNFYVQIPSKVVFFDDPQRAPNGIGPLVVLSDGDVKDLDGNVLLTHQCGVYRNLEYQLVDQDNPPKGINDAFTLTESFTDYVGPAGTPGNLSKNISEGNSGVFGDTQYFGKTAPSCLGTDDHETMKQHISAKVGNKTFSISTVVSISRGRFAGTNKVDVSISTP
jgi:hypothetical protein